MALDLSSLNSAQLAAVTHGEGPLLVVAGPGSGKTRVITSRIAWLIDQYGVAPWSILAVTFTNKAAGEMRARVARDSGGEGVHVSTFHSFGASLLRWEAEAAGLRRDFSIYATDDARGLIRKICASLGIDKDTIKPSEAAAAISAAKNQGLSPAAFDERAIGFRDEAIASIYHRYEEAMRDNGAMDFDDLLLKSVSLLTGREDLRAKYAARYRFVLVDEYQDTNTVQYALTKLLCSGHRNVCITGDPDQCIYSWRGADLSNILNFERDFPGARVVVLGQNYRSSKTIVQAADALVRVNERRKGKDLFTHNEQGAAIRVVLTQSETHEGIKIADTILDLVREEGLHYRDCAVFYRTNAQSRSLEAGLRDAAIPYTVVGSVEFYHRREVADVVAWLRLLMNPFDEIAFARAIQSPGRGVGDASVDKLILAARGFGLSLLDALHDQRVLAAIRGKPRAGIERFSRIIEELRSMPRAPVAPILERLLELTKFEEELRGEDAIRGEERAENVRELVSDAARFDEDTGAGVESARDLAAYLEKVALISDVDKWDTERDSVSLMTLHSAKGLEFDAVFIGGFEDGVLPHARSIYGGSADNLEEERRLFYVGMTRARKHLMLTLARMRSALGATQQNAPSRFLEELPRECLSTEDATGGTFGVGWNMGRAASRLRERSLEDVPFGVEGEDDVAQPDPEESVAVGLRRARPQAASLRSMRGMAGDPEPPMEDSDSGVASQFNVGDRVRHQMFGLGSIIAFSRHGSGTRAKIRFDGWGEKNLALEYARLVKV